MYHLVKNTVRLIQTVADFHLILVFVIEITYQVRTATPFKIKLSNRVRNNSKCLTLVD